MAVNGSPNVEVTVRDARAEDLDDIHDMLGHLIAYQKLPHCAIDIETLKRCSGFFPPNTTSYYHAFVAEAEDSSGNKSLIGYSLDYFLFKTGPNGLVLYIEDLFVKESARGLHAGFLLLKESARRALNHSCNKMFLQCLEDNIARKFYEKYGGKWNGSKSGIWLDYDYYPDVLEKIVQQH
jgi:GNAT superfamily N-acetyltransferase